MDLDRGGSRRLVKPALLIAGIVLIAGNLRAVLTAVGPVLPEIARDVGLSPAQQGVLVALPVAAFAVCSPVASQIASRWGTERTLLGALLLLIAGVLLRSAPLDGAASVWAGTAAIGAAIAVCNVLLPVLVHGGFPDRSAAVTGYYIAVQSIVAALASFLTVPIALGLGSWRVAVAVWGVFVIAALATWRPRMVVARPGGETDRASQDRGDESRIENHAGAAEVTMWRSPLAWQVAAYFGLQSSSFYILMNWLPTVEQDMGISAEAAGGHLALMFLTGIVATFLVPPFLDRARDQRAAATVVPLLLLVAMAGLAVLPQLAIVWVAASGFAASAAMVVSLVLISKRAGRPDLTSRLSSMVQGTAYATVSVALIVAGLIREVAGPGRHVLGLVIACALCQVAVARRAGLDRRVSDNLSG